MMGQVGDMHKMLNGIPGDEVNIGVVGIVREIRADQKSNRIWLKGIASLMTFLFAALGAWIQVHK
jgi:hypothetical protein